ncbi:MAG: hypothetical protein AAGD22_06895 [Verrucomicrobiota bacterium]
MNELLHSLAPSASFVGVLATIFWALAIIIQTVLAIAVFTDGRFMRARNQDSFLVGPLGWGLLTLVSGLLAVSLHWAVHHSTLRPARISRETLNPETKS